MKTYVAAIVLIGALAAGVGWYMMTSQEDVVTPATTEQDVTVAAVTPPPDAAPTEDAAEPEQALPDPDQVAVAPEVNDMVLGSPDAPVTVIEYASYTCPHCAAFHADQFKSLKADYIDTGKVQFIYREVYFDRFGLWASMIARCGGEMRFFGITEMLYAEQQEWIAGGDPVAISENLRRIGRTAGMDDATLDACLTDETKAQTLVAWFQANAEADGVESTPTLIIDGEKHANMSYPELAALIDAALAQ